MAQRGPAELRSHESVTLDSGRDHTTDHPERIGSHLIRGVIGAGGMGTVYLGEQSDLRRQVAVKVIHRSLLADDSVSRFRREASVLARLSHPNIVRIYDFGQHEGDLFLVMELLEGVGLDRILGQCGRFAPEQAIDLLIQMFQAIAHCHAHGILHRDLKPGNILVVGGDTPKVLDFGLARTADSTALTQEVERIGSPRFMPPEHLAGADFTERSDIYQLGLVGLEMVSGRPAFQASSISELFSRILRGETTELHGLRDALDPGLLSFIADCIRTDPQDRFRSAEEAVRRLGHLKDAATGSRSVPVTRGQTTAPPGTDPSEGSRWTRHGRAAVGVGLIILSAIGLARSRTSWRPVEAAPSAALATPAAGPDGPLAQGSPGVPSDQHLVELIKAFVLAAERSSLKSLLEELPRTPDRFNTPHDDPTEAVVRSKLIAAYRSTVARPVQLLAPQAARALETTGVSAAWKGELLSTIHLVRTVENALYRLEAPGGSDASRSLIDAGAGILDPPRTGIRPRFGVLFANRTRSAILSSLRFEQDIRLMRGSSSGRFSSTASRLLTVDSSSVRPGEDLDAAWGLPGADPIVGVLFRMSGARWHDCLEVLVHRSKGPKLKLVVIQDHEERGAKVGWLRVDPRVGDTPWSRIEVSYHDRIPSLARAPVILDELIFCSASGHRGGGGSSGPDPVPSRR